MRIYFSQFYVIIKMDITAHIATPTIIISTKLVYSLYKIWNEKENQMKQIPFCFAVYFYPSNSNCSTNDAV
jgi:hypothetical protein